MQRRFSACVLPGVSAGVGAPGLEPGASALSGPRSDRLSYAPRCHADCAAFLTEPALKTEQLSGIECRLNRPPSARSPRVVRVAAGLSNPMWGETRDWRRTFALHRSCA